MRVNCKGERGNHTVGKPGRHCLTQVIRVSTTRRTTYRLSVPLDRMHGGGHSVPYVVVLSKCAAGGNTSQTRVEGRSTSGKVTHE